MCGANTVRFKITLSIVGPTSFAPHLLNLALTLCVAISEAQ